MFRDNSTVITPSNYLIIRALTSIATSLRTMAMKVRPLWVNTETKEQNKLFSV